MKMTAKQRVQGLALAVGVFLVGIGMAVVVLWIGDAVGGVLRLLCRALGAGISAGGFICAVVAAIRSIGPSTWSNDLPRKSFFERMDEAKELALQESPNEVKP